MGSIIKNAEKEKLSSPIPTLSMIKDNRKLEAMIDRFADVKRLIEAHQSQIIGDSKDEAIEADSETHTMHSEFDEDD